MDTTTTVEQVAMLAAKLTPQERVQLIEQIAQGLIHEPSPRKRSWDEIKGIMSHPICGEDAQAWVTRTRKEGDERREKQLRKEPPCV
jgi:hypothetical protein